MYDNIAQACELFTKFAGYTEEYLVFHSSLYELHKGLYMPTLLDNTPEMSETITDSQTQRDQPSVTVEVKILNTDRVVHSYTVGSASTGPVEYLLEYQADYYHHATKYLITAIYNDITDEVDASVAEYGLSLIHI